MAAPHWAEVEALRQKEFEVCGICEQADDTPEAPMVYLACAHKFHQECLDAYKATRGFSDDEMQCPMCKMTQLEAAAREQENKNCGTNYHQLHRCQGHQLARDQQSTSCLMARWRFMRNSRLHQHAALQVQAHRPTKSCL